MDLDDLLESMERGHKKAQEKAKETGQDIENMLFSILDKKGEEEAESIEEMNAKGKTLPFVCPPSSIPTPIRNCHRMNCDGCKQEVWMSPGTKTVFDQVKSRLVICLDCLAKQMKKMGLDKD